MTLPLFAEIKRRHPTISNGEARRLVRASLVRVNGHTARDEAQPVNCDDQIEMPAQSLPPASEAPHSADGTLLP